MTVVEKKNHKMFSHLPKKEDLTSGNTETFENPLIIVLMLKTRTSTLSEMSFHLNKAILFKEASFE
jgi:hypothetical protein